MDQSEVSDVRYPQCPERFVRRCRAFAIRHPAVALLGFLPPVWVVGGVCTYVIAAKEIRRAKNRGGVVYDITVLRMGQFMSPFWPLAFYDELLERKYFREQFVAD